MTTKQLTTIIKEYSFPSKEAFIEEAIEEKVLRLKQTEFFAITDRVRKGLKEAGIPIKKLEDGLKT